MLDLTLLGLTESTLVGVDSISNRDFSWLGALLNFLLLDGNENDGRLVLGSGIFIGIRLWHLTTRIPIEDLLNSRDVTPIHSLRGKEKQKAERDNRERPVVDFAYTVIRSGPNNNRQVLIIDVLDSTGNKLKALYPRPSIIRMPCTFNGQPWQGLRFSNSGIDRPSNQSEQFVERTYTDSPIQYTGCWVPRPNMTNSSTQNTTMLSAGSPLLHSSDGRSVFAKKQ